MKTKIKPQNLNACLNKISTIKVTWESKSEEGNNQTSTMTTSPALWTQKLMRTNLIWVISLRKIKVWSSLLETKLVVARNPQEIQMSIIKQGYTTVCGLWIKKPVRNLSCTLVWLEIHTRWKLRIRIRRQVLSLSVFNRTIEQISKQKNEWKERREK